MSKLILRSFHILSSSLTAADALIIWLFTFLILVPSALQKKSSKVFKVVHHLDSALVTKGNDRIGDAGSSDRHNFGLLIPHLEFEFPCYITDGLPLLLIHNNIDLFREVHEGLKS